MASEIRISLPKNVHNPFCLATAPTFLFPLNLLLLRLLLLEFLAEALQVVVRVIVDDDFSSAFAARFYFYLKS